MANPSKRISGQATVAAAGTPVRLDANASPVEGQAFHIIARTDDGANTGDVAIGNNGGGDLGDVGMDDGLILEPGKDTILEVHSLRDIWMDADNNDDGVSWIRIA